MLNKMYSESTSALFAIAQESNVVPSRRAIWRRRHFAVIDTRVDTARRVHVDVLPGAILFGPAADMHIIDMSVRPTAEWAEHHGLIIELNRCF